MHNAGLRGVFGRVQLLQVVAVVLSGYLQHMGRPAANLQHLTGTQSHPITLTGKGKDHRPSNLQLADMSLLADTVDATDIGHRLTVWAGNSGDVIHRHVTSFQM